MDFIDKIRDLSARIPKQLEHIQTEEATKNALIMPFIGALGYNVFDPTEVTPELSADVGTKKGEKVDYAILQDGKPIILFECKWHGCDLSKEHTSQLYRYFSATTARFGILTNGLHYWVYTDLDAPNKMDEKPFFEFNMLSVREQDVEELKKFTKSAFDLDSILTTASELKYTREIKRILAEELQSPSESFVKFLAPQVYNGRMTQSTVEWFTPTIQRALKQFINDRVNERLKAAAALDTTTEATGAADTAEAVEELDKETVHTETTSEEIEGYHIVKSIMRELIDTERIAMRDQQSYCGILLDNNNRKPVCRLWFNREKKYIGLFDGESRKEERVPIGDLDDIYRYADRLRATLQRYEGA
jgi:hypothetical protein